MKEKLIYTCPVCNNKLTLINTTLKCKMNHSFDFAKEKYVNLYHNKGINAGDDMNMLKARKEFLDKGYYKVIANVLNEYIYKDMKEKNSKEIYIIDAGCGEGYYLDELNKNLLEKNLTDIQYYGFDIAKRGIQLAAKRNKNIHWFVANSNNIPIEDDSIDYFINMFSYYNVDEISRILKKDGQGIIFRAGKHHLFELKDILYDDLYLKDSAIELEHPQLIIENIIHYNTKILIKGSEDLYQLLLMTPHYWKTKRYNQELLKQLDSLDITIDIDLYIIKNK